MRVTGAREIQVLHPFSGDPCATLRIRDGAVATSGLDRRGWHVVDPATDTPAWTGTVAATALAPTALEAEALAKAALLGDPEVLRRHGGLIVDDQGDVQPPADDRPRPRLVAREPRSRHRRPAGDDAVRRPRPRARDPRRPALQRQRFAGLHEQLSLISLVAIAVHGEALLGDRFLHPGPLDIAVPVVIDFRPAAVAAGIVGGYLAAFLALSFYARKRFGAKRWRTLHRFTTVAWALAVVHTLSAGTDERLAADPASSRSVGVVAALLSARLLGTRSGSRRSSTPRSSASARSPGRVIPSATSSTVSGDPLAVVLGPVDRDLLVVEHVVVGLVGGLERARPRCAATEYSASWTSSRRSAALLRAAGLVVDQLVGAVGAAGRRGRRGRAACAGPSVNENERSNQTGSASSPWKRSW